MALKKITRIETMDGEVYEFPSVNESDPKLVEIQLMFTKVDVNGYVSTRPENYFQKFHFHMKQEEAESYGAMLSNKQKAESPPEKTVEDLLAELMERIGVYPQE